MSTCYDCIHHAPRPDAPGYGECRQGPPTHARLAGVGMAGEYMLTADELPACGAFRPLVPLQVELPAFEIKGDPQGDGPAKDQDRPKRTRR